MPHSRCRELKIEKSRYSHRPRESRWRTIECGATQSQTEKNSEEENLKRPEQIFAGIYQMHASKAQGPNDGGRPKSNRLRQCKLHT
jgi:hypothetical protein